MSDIETRWHEILREHGIPDGAPAAQTDDQVIARELLALKVRDGLQVSREGLEAAGLLEWILSHAALGELQ